MREVEAALAEGMRGLLIYQEVQNRTSRLKNSRVVVHSVEMTGDGSWRLRLALSGTHSQLNTLTPLWPTPPFNLMGRRLRINCLKKPTVFLFNDGEQLEDAQGYAADIVQEIKRQLNFTDILVPNTGFGAYRNGSWNGMVGDLLYGRADVSPLDFTPIWQRSVVIDFGRIYSTDDVVIISRTPRAFVRPLLLLQIFTPFVWASLVAVAIAAGLALSILVKAREVTLHKEGSKGTFSYCRATFGIFVYQSKSRAP
ncbi:glutamate receptor ionotropic, delta-1-like [Eriocheir sinensis]|uniref:glutamate receptor ionotropic, delta-1-like n=1 Tax=Eriocheir sinensis TaxID=95602 RepID=UPI0021C6085D|nr:glutamate receptor ionotropic, delta-1-like [Eriocheir sinensis]